RQERRRHATAGAQKCPAIDPLPAGRLVADLLEPRFVALLLRRLHRRDELLVGHDPTRDRQRTVVLSVEVTLAHPHGQSPAAGEGEAVCRSILEADRSGFSGSSGTPIANKLIAADS